MTSAAAPSETSEQSVRFSGSGDERGSVRFGAAEGEAEVLAHLRVGIATPFCGFFAAIMASASDWSPWRWK
jgi:hypothetical protein